MLSNEESAICEVCGKEFLKRNTNKEKKKENKKHPYRKSCPIKKLKGGTK